MDYEKEYKEARERAKEYSASEVVKNIIEYIFPELKESEDEKVKKAIKYSLDYMFTNNTTIFEVNKEQCIAWLEKQSELKPVSWTEEDEKTVGNLLSELSNLSTRNLIKEETRKKYTDWLKSLRPQNN